jgi:GNAT superfamily N-acetyltransferase
MVNIGLNAMPMDPQWNWRFEHRDRFPDDYKKSTRNIYRGFLENRPGNWCVLLAEKPVGGIHGVLQPVAFAVWNVGNLLAFLTATLAIYQQYELRNGSGERFPLRLGCCLTGQVTSDDGNTCLEQALNPPRRDANPERMKAWTETMCQAKSRIFNAQLGHNYFQLQILATHPRFQRQGAASELCHWGIKAARDTGFSIAVFASPMGRELYSRLGFEWCDDVRICASDDDEEIQVAAMAYRPKMPL